MSSALTRRKPAAAAASMDANAFMMVVTRRDRVQCWEEMRFLCKCKRANSGLRYAEWVSMRTQCLVISLGTAVNDGVQYQRLLLTVTLA